MANYTKKTTVNTKLNDSVEVNRENEVIKNDNVSKKVVENVERTYDAEDLIPCRSMVSGGLYIEGDRSHLMYMWADCDDIVDVEYRDLIFMVRSANNKNIYEPRIVVEDEEFVNQNPNLLKFYESMYTRNDLKNIIDLPDDQMVRVIETLPNGCKETLKGIIATMMDNGELDSISKIKALDSVFGTNMMLILSKN